MDKIINNLRLFIYSRKPACIISCRLFGRNNEYIKIHREIFLKAFFKSGLLHFLRESYALVKWYFYYAWKMPVKYACKKGKEVRKSHGIKITKQIIDLLKLSLFHNITPDKYYQYRLYLKENKGNILNYFYTFELPHFHIVTNRDNKHFYEARELIADKSRFTEELRKHNIPHVPIIADTGNIGNPGIDIFFRKENVFCKTNYGSKAKNAFKVRYLEEQDSYEIQPVHGDEITNKEQVTEFLRRILKSRTRYIIQKFIETSPDIKSEKEPEKTSTVRIITIRNKSGVPEPVYLQIEIPHQKGKNSRQFYRLYPLDLKTFEVTSIFKATDTYKKIGDIHISDSFKAMLPKALALCSKAHEEIINLKSVAFDLIINAEGPVILEANLNWDIELLYGAINPDEVINLFT